MMNLTPSEIARMSLSEWRERILQVGSSPVWGEAVRPFPSDAVMNAYLDRIDEWPEAEIRQVLRLMLGESRTYQDEEDQKRLTLELLWRYAQMDNKQDAVGMSVSARTAALTDEMIASLLQLVDNPELASDRGVQLTEMDRRILLRAAGAEAAPTWEGLTWILDLLPGAPHEALSVLSAYSFAHRNSLGDMTIHALSDAEQLIRERYISVGSAAQSRQQLLLDTSPRDFEWFVAAIWEAQGFDVEVTPSQKDGGRDVVARRAGPNRETVYLECRSGKSKSSVTEVRQLLGTVVADGGATRGVLVSASGFTRGPGSATEFAESNHSRLSLVGGPQLIEVANAHLGHNWPRRLSGIVRSQYLNQERREAKTETRT